MTAVSPAPDLADTSTDDDDLNHYFCSCSPYKGLCGADLTGLDIIDLDEGIEHDCIVCVHMEEQACERCGSE